MLAGAELGGLAFARDERLYAALRAVGRVVELDPATGAIIRNVVTLNGVIALAIDPISGDLFATNFDGVWRISNFNGGPGTLTLYYSTFFTDGIAFDSDGTLYVVSGDNISRVNGTNTPNPGTGRVIARIANGDGIGVEPNPSQPN